MSRVRLPSIALAAAGVAISVLGVQAYLVPVEGTALGWARELALVGHLVVGGVLISIGVRDFRRNRYSASGPLLVGLLAVWLLAEFDFYSFSNNTQLVLSIGFLVVAGSIAGTWVLLQRSVI